MLTGRSRRLSHAAAPCQLAMAPGGVLLAVHTPLASHPLARLRDVPTQLVGYCLYLELPMVTQTLHVFSVYSPPAGTQSNDAVRGHLISYLDKAMEGSHKHPCLLAGDFNHDARRTLAATCSSPLLALAKRWRLRHVNASIPNLHLTHFPHAAANAPSMIDEFLVSTSLFD